jgi:hypothetical protein
MPSTEHEREICDLIIRLHLQRAKEILGKSWYPEDGIPPPPNAIDAVYVTNMREYVVEHTTVESYASQITEDYKMSQMLTIEHKLCRRITNHGHYEITFNTETLKDKRICATLVEDLCTWVVQKAPTLEIPGSRTARSHMVTDILTTGGRSIEISLYRWPGTGVSVTFSRASPEDQKQKLLEWKRNRHAFSILILESIDPALVSGHDIAHAVCVAIQEHAEKPETIFIIQTDRDECEVWELLPPFRLANFSDRGYYKLKRAV